MSRLAQIQAIIPRIRTRMQKADSFDAIVPAVLSCSVQLAEGDAAKGRAVASMAAPIAAIIAPLPWATGMVTSPGAFVYDPAGTHVYIYTGKASMTHGNGTFYPGAAGVYYWAIVPEMCGGIKVYPDVTGIIVDVKHDEIWYNTAKNKKYRWNDADNNACAWYPGQPGVHQWVAV